MSDGTGRLRLVVIGAGPGGYAAAFRAADLGLDVTLIDPEANPGGVCLFRGCIPSKTLLHLAKLVHECEEWREWGVEFGSPHIDLGRLRQRKDEVIARLTGGLGALSKSRRIRYVQAKATFLDAHTVRATGAGIDERFEFDHAIIATGSSPVRLDKLFGASARILDSTSALELADIPARLLVVGAGYIGLELGTVYAALGSRVTVVEAQQRALYGCDPDLVQVLDESLRRRFEAIWFDTRVVEAETTDDDVRVKLVGLDLPEPVQTFDRVLVAVGRRPNADGLGLEHTAVERDEQGFIITDAQRRTAEPTIWAIGDVAGQPMLAHKASYEARIAVEALAGLPSAYEPNAIPAVVFTDPEVAWCGLTETAALEHGIDVKVTRFPWTASGRATTLGRNEGLTKLVLDPASERVLGMGIVGYGAGELISEGVLAVEMGARARDVEMTIHPHPTLSETVMEAADLFFGHAPHYRPRG